MIAEYERTKIRERCRRGRLFAARAGKVSVLGGAPFGYRYITKQEGGGQARYVVEFTEAPIARELFEWVGVEGCSLNQVCNRLKDRGVLTRRGHSTWDRATVSDMLSNPAYMGEARYGKIRIVPARPRLRPRRGVPEYPRRSSAKEPTAREEQIPITVPALVSPELFAAVQERLAERSPSRGTCWQVWWYASTAVTPTGAVLGD
jgi:site-specific DNA recombinase